jgi:hypothetical protein
MIQQRAITPLVSYVVFFKYLEASWCCLLATIFALFVGSVSLRGSNAGQCPLTNIVLCHAKHLAGLFFLAAVAPQLFGLDFVRSLNSSRKRRFPAQRYGRT